MKGDAAGAVMLRHLVSKRGDERSVCVVSGAWGWEGLEGLEMSI